MKEKMIYLVGAFVCICYLAILVLFILSIILPATGVVGEV